ncbi:UNVERIFIED_CONTAM: Retrovirus-related Pol polyprotein from transposon gypsy [Sesamum latifolium]|uniref:Retrovirus-related Pol polyprotein from transposon gypsy n=1 Tax=Sesamum latifolium TaxID=2727402 RepID=A0AAW2SRK6_9LAMI
MPDLPKYDGTKDPQEHVAAFELVINLYGQSSAINAKLFVTTLTGKAQEWFTSLPSGGIETFEQLVQKFTFHFASKRKQKRSATYLSNIRQKEDESLKNFIGRFNNETLEIQDLRIDMMVSILIHDLKKRLFASALARDPPEDVEQLMRVAQKYIDEEEINAMKDGEWQRSKDRGRWKDSREKNVRVDKERDPPYRPKFHRYTPLATTRTKALMMVEKSNLLQWPQHTRFTPVKKYSNRGTLKNKLERDESRDHKVGDRRNRSRSRSRDRFRGKEMEDRRNVGNRENVPVKGVINTIAGGPGGGDSRRSRKQSLRSTREDRRKEWIMNVEMEEEITFGPKDLVGKQGSQDDPMGSEGVRSPRGNYRPPSVYGGRASQKNYDGKGEQEERIRKGEEEAERGETKRPKMERIGPVEEHISIELIAGQPEKVTRIGSSMSKSMETMMIEFLRKSMDLFAWSSSDFKGIDPEVIVHRLNVDPMMRPIKQKKRSFGAKRNRIIEEEVSKLIEAGYVSEVQYTDWLANVVVVPKASGKWRMCIDFTDLNKACPKDPYPLPWIDLLVDSTAGYELFSMMDAYQGYHQIFMAEEDRIKTSLITDRGIYCYNVMPFGLKNAWGTYQRLVNKMFKDQVGTTMEVYVDDMLVKSRKEEDHLEDLRQAFEVMRTYEMKLNPSKCTFAVRGGKFLGYMVSERGIEANPEKIEAISRLQSPRTLKEVQKLTGKVASLSRFISRSADRSLLFFKSLGKAKEFKWTEECEQAL